MENNITLKKNTRQHVAEWIAVILCLAAAPVPCMTIMSATKVLSEQWNCLPERVMCEDIPSGKLLSLIRPVGV